MDIIIQQIAEKISKSINTNFLELLKDGTEISDFIININSTLDEIGVTITQEVLETLDLLIKDDKNRKKIWEVKSKAAPKTLNTIFGQVKYKRTYYKNKKNGEYKYLSDEKVGIRPGDKMDIGLKSRLIEEAVDSPYRKSGKKATENIELTGQTVMNSIRELGAVENSKAEIKEKGREVTTLYIEADEDHVALQNGKCAEPKLVYVHEGRKKVGKNRHKLQNVRVFSGMYSNSEDLWLEVASYLEEAYDTEKIEKIYLSGDGASWIKQGKGWINKSIYVLDRFHLSKYVKVATAHKAPLAEPLWKYINKLEQENVGDLLNVIIEDTEKGTKREAVKNAKRYIMNNWEGIKNQYNEDYPGCSAEGHVSHILSSRLSSRPLGWSTVGIDEMSRLRAYKANGGKVYDLLKEKRKKELKEERMIELSNKSVNKIISRHAAERLGNITILEIGKRTWAREMLKSFRGA